MGGLVPAQFPTPVRTKMSYLVLTLPGKKNMLNHQRLREMIIYDTELQRCILVYLVSVHIIIRGVFRTLSDV